MNVADILQAQQTLGKTPAGGMGRQMALDFVHHILEDIPEGAIIHGDPVAAQALIRRGAETSKALRNMDVIDAASARAEVAGGKSSNYGTQISSLLRPKQDNTPNQFAKNLSPELKAQLDKIKEGTFIQRNVLRPVHDFLGSRVGGFLPAALGIAEGSHGGMLGDIAGAAFGETARLGVRKAISGLDSRITSQAMDRLSQQALGEAPLNQGMPIPNQVPPQQPVSGLLPKPQMNMPGPNDIRGPGFTMSGNLPPRLGPNESSINPMQGHWPSAPQLALPPPQRLLPPPQGGMPMGAQPPPVIPMGGGGGLPALRGNTLPAVSQMTGPNPARLPSSRLDRGPGTGGQSDLGRLQMVQDRLRGVLEAEKRREKGKKLARSGALSQARRDAKAQEDQSKE